MTETPKRRLGEILIERNLLLPEQLDEALAKQKETGRRLGQVIVDSGLITYDELVSALSEQTGIPHIWIRKGLVDPKVVGILDREKAESYSVIPMFKVHNTLSLAMADSTALFVIDDIESITGCQVQPVQSRSEDIEKAILEYYEGGLEMEGFLDSFQIDDVQIVESQFEDLHMVEEMAEGARIINLVNLMLMNAIKEGASDIHIEPNAKTSRVRYRVDGALREVMLPRADLHPAIVSRIKVMSNMDIAERRLPQDGRMHVRVGGREVNVRISSMPMVEGEKVVMRILDSEALQLDIDQIGFHGETLEQFKRVLGLPYGILLVTGPTGSGKTTTLYSALTHISTIQRNIVTVEDPVEYQLELINQIQVNEGQGLTFAHTLRSVLRQDPDVIMVGEIRDRETAEVAIQAGLTGHLVLSTLHTNESSGAIGRLVEMGIEPYLLSSSINAVAAQRLLRRICPKCRTDHFPSDELLQRVGWKKRNKVLVMGSGCEDCFHSGYRGRQSVMELLMMDEGLRKEILKDASSQSISAYCRTLGMIRMKDEGYRLVESGMTSLEEVMRVLFVEESADEHLLAMGI